MTPIDVMDGISIDTVIFCEDVRSELNGKVSLLGVFSAGILVPSFPVTLRVGIYMQGEATKHVSGPLNVRIRLDATEVISIKGLLDTEKGPVAIPLAGLAVTLPSAGTLHLEASATDTNWIEIMTKSVGTADFKDGILISPTA